MPDISDVQIYSYMTYWALNYLLAFVIAILLSGLIIPEILRIAYTNKLFDTKDERKIHRGIIPRLGGIAFLPSIAFSVCLVLGLYLINASPEDIYYFFRSATPLLFMICAVILIYLCGVADDLVRVHYFVKFLIQTISGILIIISGLWVKNLYGFFWIEDLPNWLGWIITIFGIIYIINSVNLIDGIDGLSSGLSAIALIWYSYLFYASSQYTYLILAGAALGVLVPFFYFNVFGNVEKRTKIFMGDAGSLTMGAILVFLSIKVLNLSESAIPHEYNVFIIAISPIILPCFDVVRVFFYRIIHRQNPFLPDKNHIHHRLLAIGLKQWQVLLVIGCIDVIILITNVVLSSEMQPTWIITGDIVLWIIFNWVLTWIINHRKGKIQN